MGKRFRSKVWIIILVFVLLTVLGTVSLIVTEAKQEISAYAEGDGTAESPYLLYNEKQIRHLQQTQMSGLSMEDAEKLHFKLMTDVRLLYPASEKYSFRGKLDGNGHTIELSNNRLFYILANGTEIKNLHLVSKQKYYLDGFSVSSSFVGHSAAHSAAFYQINAKAVVKDCTIEYDIRLSGRGEIREMSLQNENKLSAKVACAGVTCYNYGLIENCDIVGKISAVDRIYARTMTLRIAGVAMDGTGYVQNCRVTFNGKISLEGNADVEYYGISYQSRAMNSSIDCDVFIEGFKDRKVSVCTIAYVAHNSRFSGNIRLLLDKNATVPLVKTSFAGNNETLGEITKEFKD